LTRAYIPKAHIPEGAAFIKTLYPMHERRTVLCNNCGLLLFFLMSKKKKYQRLPKLVFGQFSETFSKAYGKKSLVE
jgi:hypothetical protein